MWKRKKLTGNFREGYNLCLIFSFTTCIRQQLRKNNVQLTKKKKAVSKIAPLITTFYFSGYGWSCSFCF